MRGCVPAGMVCAIEHLGLRDAFDGVYGSSAGIYVCMYICMHSHGVCHKASRIERCF